MAQEAIRRAREGHGPGVIECLTARGNANSEGERSSSQYLAQDPISFMEQYLRRRDLWSEEWSRLISEGFDQELKQAADSLEHPADVEGQFDNVYSSNVRTSRPTAASAR